MAEPGVVRPLAGVAWMLASGVSFVAVNGIVYALGTGLPAAQSAFLRFGWSLLFTLPLLVRLTRAQFPPGAMVLFAGRGAVHTVAVILWFYAMARLPVAEVTAIGYLNPVAVTLGAALIFGEVLAWRRVLAIGAALAGALIVLRPGMRELGAGQMAQVGAAVFFAASYLFTKRISRFADAGVIVAVLSLTVPLGLLPLAIAVWVPVTLPEVLWLAVVAVAATSGHYCMTRAFLVAPLTVTQPVTFLQLVWASLLGVLAFDEGIDPWVLVGGAVIIAAISWMTWAEARAAKRAEAPVSGGPEG